MYPKFLDFKLSRREFQSTSACRRFKVVAVLRVIYVEEVVAVLRVVSAVHVVAVFAVVSVVYVEAVVFVVAIGSSCSIFSISIMIIL